MISASSLGAWRLLRNGWRPWSESLAAPGRALQESLEAADPDAFEAALLRELLRRHGAFLTGLERYRAHPARRALAAPPPLWEDAPARLLDYGVTAPAGEDGRPILVVPSLVNRSYILDLTAKASMMRFLASQGFRPLLLDWGTPGETQCAFGLDDYVTRYLFAALDTAVAAAGGRPVPVVGYCMGGNLAVALAALRGEAVSSLACLATPWDFHAATAGPPAMVTSGRPMLETAIAAFGYLPVDLLQALFFWLDPAQGWQKFRHFAALDPDGDAAAAFVALEDWLNDGVPLAGPVARQCLFGWYGENAPAAGGWQVNGTAIRPGTIDLPALVVVPARDRIVPPQSAAALAAALPRAEALTPRAGHIGMAVGSAAKGAVWEPLASWLRDH